MPQIDKLFSTHLNKIADFSFDENVAAVFPDMIARSIPGYPLMIENIGRLARQYCQADSTIYDLGCATGTATLSMAKHVAANNCQIVGIDNSPAMVKQCQQFVSQYHHPCPIKIECADITNYAYQPSSVILMNFTLQFLAPHERQAMIQRIYDALLPGGVLILSEKFTHEDVIGNELLVDLHHQFKGDNGYSDLEISQKRTALEKVMLTDTMSTHTSRLDSAGFAHIIPWFSCFNFMSLVAVK
ncbi:MAG: carboxy-S-adenosyl-L-methionine synthase CmoA [Glaciecola sp.]|jgi:tRNA (cmo5U34)-methyltransferase|nr:carboxy-S-adenosyl-L-methionine synthase CmoA [Glaciecola sp.]MDG1814728.1 carboxy-S-adenosyl-L-methionine synthase CmoA [Glaciecola sp.]MDG2100422.1 carboxy-S-adenosyl-L-methionine synthase CmoA [Glaciecola sp.]